MNNRLAEKEDLQFIDVRRAGEFESGHAPKTVNLTGTAAWMKAEFKTEY